MSDFLILLVRATLAVTIAIIAAIVLRRPIRKRFGCRAAYQLWSLTPDALSCAVLPIAPGVLPVPAPRHLPASNGLEVVWNGYAQTASDYAGLAVLIWATGAALTLTWVFARQQRFIRLAKAGKAGPAVVGAVFPKVILPSDFETRFTEVERQMILAHERRHLACGDSAVTGLIALVQCLAWFNPLVHVAAHLARLDQELACDADIIAEFPLGRRSYATAMLKAQSSPVSLVLGCTWPARSIHPLEERIAMLNDLRPSRTWRRSGAALVAVLALGAGYAACATQWAPGHISSATLSATDPARGLTIRLVDERVTASSKDGELSLQPSIVVSGDMIADARAVTDQQGRSVVRFRLTPEGASRFAAVTRANVGRRMAILVDGKVMVAPVIRDQINGGTGEISGNFPPDQAKAIAAAIVSGRPSR